jgi:hypothetical protein
MMLYWFAVMKTGRGATDVDYLTTDESKRNRDGEDFCLRISARE